MVRNREKFALGKTGGCRNRNDEFPEPDVHRVADRPGHGVAGIAGAAGSSIVISEGGRHVRSEITALGIGDGRRRVRAYRGFDRSTARTVFYGEMKASSQKERKAQRDGAEQEQDEHRRDDGKFYRGGAFLVSGK